MKWEILLLLLLIHLVVAEEEVFETTFNTTLSNGTIKILTESSEHIYDCSENRTIIKNIILKREIKKGCTNQSTCTAELGNLSSTCSVMVSRLDSLTKDRESYAGLYNSCKNDLDVCKAKKDYQEDYNTCKEQKGTVDTQLSTCQASLSNKEREFNGCESSRKISEEQLKNKKNPLFVGIFSALGGAGAYYLFINKKKNPKSPKEEEMGESDEPPNN